MEGGTKSKESLKAAGKKRLEEFRLRRQHKNEGSHRHQTHQNQSLQTDDMPVQNKTTEPEHCSDQTLEQDKCVTLVSRPPKPGNSLEQCKELNDADLAAQPKTSVPDQSGEYDLEAGVDHDFLVEKKTREQPKSGCEDPSKLASLLGSAQQRIRELEEESSAITELEQFISHFVRASDESLPCQQEQMAKRVTVIIMRVKQLVELRDEEALQLRIGIQQKQEDFSVLESQIASCTDRLHVVEASLWDRDEALRRLKEEVSAEKEQLQTRLESVTHRLEAALESNSVLYSRNLGLERDLEQSSIDRASAESQIQNLFAAADKQREEFKCLEHQLKEQVEEKTFLAEQVQLNIASGDDKIAEMKQRNADLTEKIEGLQKTAAAEKLLVEEASVKLKLQLDEAMVELERANSGLSVSTAVIAKQQGEMKRMGDLLNEQELIIGRLKGENFELVHKLAELKSLQTGLQKQLEETTSDRAVFEEQLEQMHDLHNQLNVLKDGNANLKQGEAPLEAYLRALDKLERKVISRLVRFSEKLEAFESTNVVSNELSEAKLLNFEVSIDTLTQQILELDSYLAALTADGARYRQELKVIHSRLAESATNRRTEMEIAAEQETKIRDLLNMEAAMQENVEQANLRAEQLQLELDAVNHKLLELVIDYEKVSGDSEFSRLAALGMEDYNEHGLGISGKVEHIARLLLYLHEKRASSEREAENLSGRLRELTEETERQKAALSDALQSKDTLLGSLESLAAEYARLEQRYSQECSKLQDRALLLESCSNENEAELHRICSSMPSQWVDEFKDEADVVRRLELSINASISGLRSSLQDLTLELEQLEGDKLELQDKLTNKVTELGDLSRKWDAEVAELKNELALLTNDMNACRTERDTMTAERDRVRLELTDSEQRLLAVRDKLGLAVRKGKNLAQQRDELKLLLEQKSTEINTLNTSWRTKLDAELQKQKDEIDQQLESLHSAARLKEEHLVIVKTGLESSQMKAEALATELAVEKRKYADIVEQNEDHVRQMRSLNAEVSRMTADLNEYKSLESAFAAQTRKYAEALEEKQLLEESKREAWLKAQELVDQVDLLESEVLSKSAVVDGLQRSVQALEEEKGSVQRDLMCISEYLTSEFSEGLEKRMQVLEEVNTVAVDLLHLLFPSELDTLPKLSRWPSEKAVVFEVSSLLEHFELQHAAILERITLAKNVLREIVSKLSSFQQLAKSGFSNLVGALEMNELELATCQKQLASTENELTALYQEKERLEDILDQSHSSMGSMETSRNKAVGKLSFTLSKLNELQQQCEAMVTEIERRQVDLDNRHVEISQLNKTIDGLRTELEDRSATFSQLLMKLRALTSKVGAQGSQGDLVEVLDSEIERLLREVKNHAATVERRDLEIQTLKRQMDEFTAERLALVKRPEIEELEQPKHVTVVASSPHIRSQKKTSVAGDQVVIDVEAEILNAEEKGNAFKSMGTLRIFSKSGHYLGDQIDVLCVTVGKLLMRQPVARLSLIVYWIAVHFWIAATITVAKV